MKLLVCGYYHRYNLGDDAFECVIHTLFDPSDELTFVSIDDLTNVSLENFDHIIVGGGDLVNDYFGKKLLPILKRFKSAGGNKKVIGLGLGIPYENLIESDFFDDFDHVFIREKTDLLRCQKSLGSTRIHYLPDLVFSIPFEIPYFVQTSPSEIPPGKTIERVGVYLIGSVVKNEKFVIQMSKFLLYLSKKYQVILYRFDSSGSDGDDININRALANLLSGTSVINNIQVYNPQKMLDLMRLNKFAICMRFHSHIFSTIARVPFLSITETRKVKLYLKDIHYSKWGVDPKLEHLSLKKTFKSVERNREHIVEKLAAVSQQNKYLLQTNQVRNLLRVPTARKIQKSEGDSVFDTVQKIADEVLTLALGNIETAAQVMCLRVTGSPHSKYVHGAKQNLKVKNSKSDVLDMVKWLVEDHTRERNAHSTEGKININYISQDNFKGYHRSGWQYCVDYLSLLHDDRAILFDTYLDRTFHWSRELMVREGIIPYTSPWIGVIHHTQDENFTPYNTIRLLACDEFRKSLPTCLGLICLSNSLSQFVHSRLPTTISIVSIKHPTSFVSSDKQFTIQKFLANRKRKIINVGAWYRNPFSIHAIDCGMRKASLRGREMDNYFRPPGEVRVRRIGGGEISGGGASEARIFVAGDFVSVEESGPSRGSCSNKWIWGLEKWIENYVDRVSLPPSFSFTIGGYDTLCQPIRVLKKKIETMISSVKIIDTVSDEKFDILLSENIVFLHLVDCSAVNTIIECIVRHTPIVVNKLPAVVEYLGEHYPLYWDDLKNVNSLVTKENIQNAHFYLRNMDKSFLSAARFVDSVKDFSLRSQPF